VVRFFPSAVHSVHIQFVRSENNIGEALDDACFGSNIARLAELMVNREDYRTLDVSIPTHLFPDRRVRDRIVSILGTQIARRSVRPLNIRRSLRVVELNADLGPLLNVTKPRTLLVSTDAAIDPERPPAEPYSVYQLSVVVRPDAPVPRRIDGSAIAHMRASELNFIHQTDSAPSDWATALSIAADTRLGEDVRRVTFGGGVFEPTIRASDLIQFAADCARRTRTECVHILDAIKTGVREADEYADALDRYANDLPRGLWEIVVHFRLTGDAWTRWIDAHRLFKYRNARVGESSPAGRVGSCGCTTTSNTASKCPTNPTATIWWKRIGCGCIDRDRSRIVAIHLLSHRRQRGRRGRSTWIRGRPAIQMVRLPPSECLYRLLFHYFFS
jgi:hypothetical protein